MDAFPKSFYSILIFLTSPVPLFLPFLFYHFDICTKKNRITASPRLIFIGSKRLNETTG